jgi:uncharacterized protein
MNSESVIFAGAGLLFAGIVKGATGIGYATCALPVLASVVGLKSAMALILAPTIATNISMALFSGQVRSVLAEFLPLYVAMIPGVVVGVTLLAAVDPKVAVCVLGLLLIVYALLFFIKPSFRLSPDVARRLLIPVGFVNGFLTGLTGSQVIPLVPYMLSVSVDPKVSIRAINLGVLVLTALLSGVLFASNLVDAVLLQWSVLAIVPAVGGVCIGTYIQARLSAPMVRGLVVVVLGLMGLKLTLGI